MPRHKKPSGRKKDTKHPSNCKKPKKSRKKGRKK